MLTVADNNVILILTKVKEYVMAKFVIALCWFGMIILPIIYYIAIMNITV